MQTRGRRIGKWGAASRVAVGLGLLFLAIWFGLEWFDLLVGFIALPAVMIALGLAAGRYAAEPIRFIGPLGIGLNCAVIVALLAYPYTAGGALLFYGTTLLVAAWRGQPGCEATAISNLVLRRDDQIGCPTFYPIDEAESRLSARKASVEGSHPGAA